MFIANRRTLAVATLVAAGLATSACGGHPSEAKSGAGTPTAGVSAPAASGAPTTAPSASGSAAAGSGTKGSGLGSALGKQAGTLSKVRVGDVNLVAQSVVPKVKVYNAATGPSVQRTLPNPLPSGAPLVFLVLDRKGDRVHVLLAVRPNGTEGWINVKDVKLFQESYRITVSVSRHELKVYKSGKVVITDKVGLGESTTPTPGGVFYLKELLKPSNPGGAYGPYAYGLSGYSNALHEFAGGDGEIGLHGTDDPSSVGKNVSHGCIRMTNAAITTLANTLPLGTPLQIIA